MPVYRVTNDNFDKVLADNDIVLVDFWAKWCTTCTSFTQIYEEIADDYPDILFAKIDTQVEQEISARYRIQSIPTLIIFHEGNEVFRKPGAIASQTMRDLIAEIVGMLTKPIE